MFTTDGDVFGGFYSVAVTEQKKWFYDPNIFVFSFESHGRCMTPQRFVVKKGLREKEYVRIWKDDWNGFVKFGVEHFGFWLGKENSFCMNLSGGFEGLEDTTLTGKNLSDWETPQFHHCAHLVSIQFE